MPIKYQDMATTGNTKASRFVASVSVILYFYFVIGSFIGSIPIVYALFKNRDALVDLTFSTDVLAFMDKYVNPFANYIFTNFTIYLMLAGLVISIKFIHYRTFTSVITTKRKMQWSRFWIGFLVYGGLIAVGCVIDYFISPETYSFSFDASKFWIALPFILIMTPIQAATEEFIFRGYVIQSFGLKIKNGMLLSAISGFMFTLPHLMNPEVTASSKEGIISTLCMILNYFVVGMILAMITIKTNSLEAAVGAHAVNNLIGFLIVGYPDNVLSTNTIFYTSTFNSAGSLISVIITGVLFYFITGFIIKEPLQAGKDIKITY